MFPPEDLPQTTIKNEALRYRVAARAEELYEELEATWQAVGSKIAIEKARIAENKARHQRNVQNRQSIAHAQARLDAVENDMDADDGDMDADLSDEDVAWALDSDLAAFEPMDVDAMQAAGLSDDDMQVVDSGDDGMTVTTVGSLGVSGVALTDVSTEQPEPLQVTTAFITENAHHFMPVLFEMLQRLEALNQRGEQEAAPQSEATYSWTKSELGKIVNGWKSLSYRQRANLVNSVKGVINNMTVLNKDKLCKKLTSESKDAIAQFAANTQRAIKDKTFCLKVEFTRPTARLFTMVPIPALKRRYIKINYTSLGMILRHYGLGKHVKGDKNVPKDGTPHGNFDLFDLTKLSR
jgi:hypothetical protein